MTNENALLKLGTAAHLLAEVRDATSAKKMVDMAHAAEVYARRQKLGEEAIGYAHEIKIDAMRMLGVFLQAAEKNKGTAGGATRSVTQVTREIRKADLAEKTVKLPGGKFRYQSYPWNDFHETDSTSVKGRKAVAVVTSLLPIGRFPLFVDASESDRSTIQIQGTDIVVFHKTRIQVKCDWRCGEGPGCSGNLFIQKSERNPLRQT